MNTATKQRLVGTIVLGALALILIPLLLDGEGVEPPPAAISTTMPPAPVIDITPLPQPQRPVILADNPAAATELTEAPETEPAADANPTTGATAAGETTPEIAAGEPSPITADEPAPAPVEETAPAAESAPGTSPTVIADLREPQLNQQGLPTAWSVQLGMFGARANAEALLAQLLLANYKAYLRPQGTLNGVFVGPVMTRAEANTLRQKLATEFDLDDAIVTQFEIEPLR